ncbi:TPA: Arc family DNA-binding protein [Yersinia enterocolitica]|uniref:Arc family DNA-binding protein n=1 Tax=Yersinia TaxID=629 RepID=UPI0005DBD2B3|nr:MULTISPECIES: Arc family DNA-binding protein [Yersinia]MDN0103059.1 Arc family DNA-binding protein [Yersinia bercovieri]CFB70220.1 putative phage regulatory protein [Yersinia enterocolitica]HDL8095306.1 Arc family DNA-binding protein [Yersinia enterocolitica]
MARDEPKVNVRLPQELKDRLHALAAQNKRSVNAEIVAAIEYACRRAFGKIVEGDEGTEIILNESDSRVLKSQIDTMKKIVETEKKVDEILAALEKFKVER